MQLVLTTTLAADVAASGTFTIPYPTGFNAGHFALRNPAAVQYNVNGDVLLASAFSLSGTASAVQFTNNTGSTLLKGTSVGAVISVAGCGIPSFCSPVSGYEVPKRSNGSLMAIVSHMFVSFGAPVAASNTALANAVAVTGTGVNNITLAVPSVITRRRLRLISSNAGDTNAYRITSTGPSGSQLVETGVLNGTTPVTSRKAHGLDITMTITGAMTGNLSVGTTDILGLPFLLDTVLPLSLSLQFIDGAAPANAGSFTSGAADGDQPTGADPYGTYTPDSGEATNGTRRYELFVATLNAYPLLENRGVAGYRGTTRPVNLMGTAE